MFTSIMNKNRKTQQSTKTTLILRGRVNGLIHISSSTININTLSVIMKGIVNDLLIPPLMSSVITPTITSLIVMKTIINTKISNIYTQKSNMVTWVMGEIVNGLGPISNYQNTINIFSNIARGGVAGIFRPRSTSTIIITYITPILNSIMTYSSPPIPIIATDITPLSAMTTTSYSLITINILVNRTRRI